MKIGISILCVALLATSSAGFFSIQNIDSGVRSLGLGSSLVAVADNSDAVFINPAGLGQLMRRQVTYTHGGIADAEFDYPRLRRYMVSFGMPLNSKLGLGMGYERIGSSLMSENGAFVSLSYQVERRLQVGLSAKYLFWSVGAIPDYNGRADPLSNYREGNVGVDLGLMWQSPMQGVQMGVLLKNINQPNVAYGEVAGDEDAGALPMDAHVGAGYRLSSQWLVSVQYVRRDVTGSRDSNFVSHEWMIGVEGHLLKGLVLRAGREHKFGFDDRVSLSVGLGLRLEYREIGLLLDYAHLDDQKKSLGLQEHRFSFACDF